MPGYVGIPNRQRYVAVRVREPDNLPIVVTVTPPTIAHVRTFAYIIACLVAGLIVPVHLLR